MVVAIKLADKLGTVDVPSTYTEITIGAGLIHSYIKGLEPHQVPREMTFVPTGETVKIDNKAYPLWVLRKD